MASSSRNQTVPGRQTSTPVNVYGRAADVEAQLQHGDTPPSHHAPLLGQILPNARSLFSPPQRAATVRHAESARSRRIRQRSINLPYSDNLEEDLGYPPICTPPPEIHSSVSDSPFRFRSGSDAFRSFDLSQPSPRRNSGYLLVFPSSGNNLHSAHCRGGLVSEKTSHSAGESAARIHHVASGSTSSEGAFPPPPTPEGSQTAAMTSPLFVDTQLANSNRTPLRGAISCPLRSNIRNRTFSLNTPNLFKRSDNSSGIGAGDVSARQSQSEEQPANANSPRIPNMYGRTTMRSFDSGLGLSSPSIGQTALLIKEVRQF
ncbi:hypothetical protein WR25_00015 [Diploscapter pachys]|uniref:Uncharacterized protein n=1 Tax=Diploscapter pachys TaxID=2018661 RepID=A0A2A2KDZ9_9BILA|nr:hypothetical protein WR25_00015 [Diploscapter pachys]